MAARTTYRSSPRIFLRSLIAGQFCGFFLRMPYRLITRNVFYLPYDWEIPISFVFGLIIGAVFLFCNYTTVYVEDLNVVVVKRLKKHIHPVSIGFSIGEHHFTANGVSFEKRWLIIKQLAGNDKKAVKYRLYLFTDSACERLINQIQLLSRQKMPELVREIITDASWEGHEHTRLDTGEIIRREWKSIRTNSQIFAALVPAFAVYYIWSRDRVWSDFKFIICVFILYFCLTYILFEVLRTRKNSQRCLREISFKGDHLMINDDHYILPDIKLITVTDPNLKSRSLYSVQRYITIRNYDGMHKYWCGSEASISNEDYSEVMRILVNATVNYPDKLKHIIKRSFWTK